MSGRLRVRFSKLGKVRFTSHRDVARIWERAFRRAGVRLAYSEGFSPRPKLSFGLALSTGHESLGEYLDAELAAGAETDLDVDLDGLPALLSACLPAGLDVVALAPIAPRTVSLQADVTSCTWVIGVDGVTPHQAVEAVDGALAATELVATIRRKGEAVMGDIRPGLLELAVLDAFPLGSGDGADPGTVVLHTRLATQPHAVRPGDLVGALFPEGRERRVVRMNQWIESDGARREPIELPNATSTTRTPVVCA